MDRQRPLGVTRIMELNILEIISGKDIVTFPLQFQFLMEIMKETNKIEKS